MHRHRQHAPSSLRSSERCVASSRRFYQSKVPRGMPSIDCSACETLRPVHPTLRHLKSTSLSCSFTAFAAQVVSHLENSAWCCEGVCSATTSLKRSRGSTAPLTAQACRHGETVAAATSTNAPWSLITVPCKALDAVPEAVPDAGEVTVQALDNA